MTSPSNTEKLGFHWRGLAWANGMPITRVPMTDGTDAEGVASLTYIWNGSSWITAASTPYTGKTTVTTAGTRVVLAAAQPVVSLTVKALAANTGLIYIGGAAVASTNGFQLSAGDSISADINDLSDLWIDSSVNGEGVTYFGIG